jgi:hypothetical protein
MSATHHEHARASSLASELGRPLHIGLMLMVAAIVGFVLLREHRYHVAGSWLFLLLLPLMHLFHGRDGHDGHGEPVDQPASDKE